MSEGWSSDSSMCWPSLFLHPHPKAVVRSQQDGPCRHAALLNHPAPMLPMEEGVMDGIGLENIMGQERTGGQGFTFCIVY